MAELRLTQSEVGQEALQDWFRWPVQHSPIDSIVTTLVPMQDMLPFQRVFADLNFASQLVIATDVVQFKVPVPPNESWRVVWVQVEHDDPGGAMSWTIGATRNSGGKFVLLDHPVAAGAAFLLYPGRVTQPSAGNSSSWDLAGSSFEVQGKDELIIQSGTFTGAATVFCSIRIEKIPAANRFEQLVGNTTIVI